METLESILLSEAQKRGERLFRISLTLREECLFPWERLAIDTGRMENAFNVIRVSPDLALVRDLPERVVFHVTTALPFERAAEEASLRLDGVVDIAEIPIEAWEEERAKWTAERAPARRRGPDARAHAALLMVSYKVLRYDMERIVRACPPGKAADDAASSMDSFESRLERLPVSNLPLLLFTHAGVVHYLPRSFVAGYECADGSSGRTSLVRDLGPSVLAPDMGGQAATGRFGIVLEGWDGRPAIAADRLLCYREVDPRSITITGRLSCSCFQAAIEGVEGRLILPPPSARPRTEPSDAAAGGR